MIDWFMCITTQYDDYDYIISDGIMIHYISDVADMIWLLS